MMQGVRGLRIGIDAAWNNDDVDHATRVVVSEAAEVFRMLGAFTADVEFPDVDSGDRRLGTQLCS